MHFFLDELYNRLEAPKTEGPTDISASTQFCLSPDFLTFAKERLQMPEEALGALEEIVDLVKSRPGLTGFLDLCHRSLFTETPVDHAHFIDQQALESQLGPRTPMFPMLALFTNLHELTAYYQQKGIDQTILDTTLRDLNIWLGRCKELYGFWGLKEFNWLILHFSGKLFRLGRLQFMAIKFGGNVKAYRNIENGVVLALSEPGVVLMENGQINGTNGVFSDNTFTTSFDEDVEFIKGNEITKNGEVLREPVVLKKSHWIPVLSKGDPILDVHIPEGEKLDIPACRDSFRLAIKFFCQYFPEHAFKGFTCYSWLLDPQLQRLLPAEANICKFQRMFHLYPMLADEQQTLDRVFGFGLKLEEIKAIPRTTSLQNAIYDYIVQGGRMTEGAMFLLKEDLEV